MVGVGKSLLKASRSTFLELSKTGKGCDGFVDRNQNKVIEPANISELSEVSEMGLWGPQTVMQETTICEASLQDQMEENFKWQPCNEVAPEAISLPSDQIVHCNFCDQTFLHHDLKSLHQHILEHHYQGPKCSLCESIFASKDALKNHIRQRHLNETFTCEVCHTECKDLPFHMETFHKSEAAPAEKLPRQKGGAGVKRTCPECQKEISVDNFGRHLQEKHSKLRRFCPHCSKDFAPSNLKRHIRFASHLASNILLMCMISLLINSAYPSQTSSLRRESGVPNV